VTSLAGNILMHAGELERGRIVVESFVNNRPILGGVACIAADFQRFSVRRLRYEL
jgi:hypothetical protein